MSSRNNYLAPALALLAFGAMIGLASCGSRSEHSPNSDFRGGIADSEADAAESERKPFTVTLGPPSRELVGIDEDGEERVSPSGEPYDMFFKKHGVNPFVDSEDDRLSTFAVDVDTGSYTVCRAYLNDGNLPPGEAPRVEEFINYFDYGYEAPRNETFSITMDAAPSRYGQDLKHAHLLRIGLKAREVDVSARKPAILTFVIDVSGSMDMQNRLGLVKQSLRLLVDQLKEGDRVGIAVYGSRGRTVLEHTGAENKNVILHAIDSLSSDGSTNAEEGIRIGYRMAAESFRKGSINRVILCSDGVANVGETGPEGILKLIAEQRRKGITLSTVGFGMSNYNDTLMEQLGDKGDGHYSYVDTLAEARRVFVENLTGTLQVVARETKVQVDFNPEVVKSWRLLGYENRHVRDEDFRNDKVDGGEVGAGHAVTALYEVKLFENRPGTIAVATVRYKHDELEEFREIASELNTRHVADSWEQSPANMRLAAGAAEFAELLRKSYWAKGGSFDAVSKDLRMVIAQSDDSEVLELATLVNRAKELNEAKAASAGGE